MLKATTTANDKGQQFDFEIVTVDANGKIIHRQPKQAHYQSENLGNGVTLEMVYIPGGTFIMGSPDTETDRYNDESPLHQVTFKPFYMSKYPLTQAQWQAVMGPNNNSSAFKGDNRPIERISWNKAIEFCQLLSKQTGRHYHLPSEAEWEYCCRAGTTTPFYFGEMISTDLANYDGNYIYKSGAKGEYRAKTTEVGNFPPNAFGLYDMHGNLWEWCADSWHHNYEGAPADGSAWEDEVDSLTRLLRGGSWDNNPEGCRCANRSRISASDRCSFIGFRVALHCAAWI